MTIPTPAALAVKPCSIRTVVDTRCGAEHANGRTIFRCSLHGEHDRHIDAAHNRHIDAAHNAVWSTR